MTELEVLQDIAYSLLWVKGMLGFYVGWRVSGDIAKRLGR